MRNFFIMGLIVLGFGACKQEDQVVKMAKDVCACIMPVVEDGEKADEVLRRGNEAEIASLEAQMQKTQQNTTECFKNIEARYGNLEEFQSSIMEEMKKRCPKAAALLSGQ